MTRYSPPRRGYGGGGEDIRLWIRNLPHDCRPNALRVPFERFGPVRDVYIPRDYISGIPLGCAFVEFYDVYHAREAQRRMHNGTVCGRQVSVVFAYPRKTPAEMHASRKLSGSRGRSHGRSRSRSISQLRSPRHPSDARSRYRSRSYSTGPRRRGADYSPSLRTKKEERPRSPPLDPRKRPAERHARELSGSRGRSHGGSSSRVISRLHSPRHPSGSRIRSRSRHREGNMKSSPRRRGNDGRGRSPPPRPHLREESTHRRLLVRNIPIDCREDELRLRFKIFGPVKDVNIPSDYKSGIPLGCAFVEFFDAYHAREAQRRMHMGRVGGREVSVDFAYPRKMPAEMHASRELSGSRGRSHGLSRSRSIPRLRSPRHPSDARSRYRSRSYSPGPRRRGADNSPSPRRRQEKRPKSRRPPRGHSRRSYSPDRDRNGAKNQATGSRRHGGRAVSRSPS